jgi:transposase
VVLGGFVSKPLMARQAADVAEEKTIRKLAGARHAPADWLCRGRIVVFSWDGLRVAQIADRLNVDHKTVRRWLHRFNAAGVDGLGNRPGGGRKRRITEDQRSRIIALVKAEPPGKPVRSDWGELFPAREDGAPVWTLDSLTAQVRADGIDVHRSQVRRILKAEGVRWRRTRSWIVSTDPEFAPKGRGSSSSTPTRRRTSRWSAPTSSGR